MPILTRQYLYEVLFRFNADGQQGAHAVEIEELYDSDSGRIRSATPFDPRPVTLAEIEPLIGAANAAFAASLEEAVAQRTAEADIAVAALQEQLAAALAENAALSEQIAAAKAGAAIEAEPVPPSEGEPL